MIRDIKNILAG